MITPFDTKSLIIGQSFTESNAQEGSYLIQLPEGLFAFTSFRGIGYKKWNEDRIVILPQIPLFCVIDGLGGPGDGERAAEIFTQELAEIQNPDLEILSNAQKKTSVRIKSECHASDCGVCYALFWIEETFLKVCYIGDVKFVLLNQEYQIKWESRDHSVINDLTEQGIISKEEALAHSQRHIVTKALTGDETPQLEIQKIPFVSGDRVIIASDGLWDNFMIDEVIGMLDDPHPQVQVNLLMQKSLLKMQQIHTMTWEGRLVPKADNISILIGRF